VVSPDWVAAHVDDLRIVDVREHIEFCGPLGHIDGAELVPMSELEWVCGSWNRNDSIVVVCAYGTRSGRGAQLLSKHGFRQVASLHGGMTRWADADHPRTDVMGDRGSEDATMWQAMGI
jgi:rhodanese-related sulfurtransferase